MTKFERELVGILALASILFTLLAFNYVLELREGVTEKPVHTLIEVIRGLK